MSRMPIGPLIALSVGTWASGVSAQTALPTIPEARSMEWVLPLGRVAGRSVSIARFESDSEPDRVLAETERAWRRLSRHGVQSGRSGPWATLSRLDDDGSTVTLQIQADVNGRSHGLLSIWRDGGSATTRQADALAAQIRTWLPARFDAPRTVASVDGDRIGVTLVATGEPPVSIAWSQLQAAARRAGFEPGPPMPLPPHLSQARVGRFLRGPTELVMTLDRTAERLGLVIYLTEDSDGRAPK